MVSAVVLLIRREVRLAFRQGMDSLIAVVFFVLAVVLFPFGVGPEPNVLARIAPGVIWVAALLASLLSLERLFQCEYEDGSLELLLLQPLALELVVGAKVVAHWLTSGLLVAASAPVLASLLNLQVEAYGALVAALVLGTLTLSLIGAVGAALILGSRRGSVLLSLLVLPLYIPVLIFGVAAVDAAAAGYSVRPHLTMLGGIVLGAGVLTPWAAAAALRQALE
jgi:heme exporter protein B